MSSVVGRRLPNMSSRIKHGANGGVVAGVFFAMFEMCMAIILNGRDAFFTPLRMFSGIVLGYDALSPDYSLAGAAITGLLVHLILSFVFGMMFGMAVAWVPWLSSTNVILLTSGAVYGFLLWRVNFYVIAPAAGWNWFPDRSNELMQFVAHTVFFGIGSGLCFRRLALRWVNPDD